MSLITIGITCYRDGEWLRECWESVLAQDDDRWEAVLVMDGGADDTTKEIFNHIEHPKLRKFAFEENMGPYPVRNKAFEMTRTPYHFYLDGDDLLPPDAIRLALRGFDQCPSAAIVIGDIEYFGDHCKTHHRPREVAWDILVSGGLSGGGGAAYHKMVWEELGGFAKELARASGDLDFYIGVLETGHHIFHIGKIMYHCRTHESANSSVKRDTLWKRHEIMVRRHPRFFANERRLHAFLTRGYERSFRTHYDVGELAKAKDIATRALDRRCKGEKIWCMWFLARLPLPVFEALRPLWRLGGRTLR